MGCRPGAGNAAAIPAVAAPFRSSAPSGAPAPLGWGHRICPHHPGRCLLAGMISPPEAQTARSVCCTGTAPVTLDAASMQGCLGCGEQARCLVCCEGIVPVAQGVVCCACHLRDERTSWNMLRWLPDRPLSVQKLCPTA